MSRVIVEERWRRGLPDLHIVSWMSWQSCEGTDGEERPEHTKTFRTNKLSATWFFVGCLAPGTSSHHLWFTVCLLSKTLDYLQETTDPFTWFAMTSWSNTNSAKSHRVLRSGRKQKLCVEAKDEAMKTVWKCKTEVRCSDISRVKKETLKCFSKINKIK